MDPLASSAAESSAVGESANTNANANPNVTMPSATAATVNNSHSDAGATGATSGLRYRSLSVSLPWRRPKSFAFGHDHLHHLPRHFNDHAIDDTEEETPEQAHAQSHGQSHSLAHNSYNHHHASGSIKGIFRRASLSLKGMVHRRPSAAAEDLPQEDAHHGAQHGWHSARPGTAHTPSTWNRLRQAASFRHSRVIYDHDMDLTQEPTAFHHPHANSFHLPIPGFGGEPPIIPTNSGAAAKASAAMQNEYLARQGLQNLWLNPTTSDDGNDRESGIGITVTIPGTEADDGTDSELELGSTISRIDFITKLPIELAIHVLACLDAAALAKASEVSQNWKKIVANQHIWRESCLREMTTTYATSGPVAPGTGLGIPPVSPSNDWKEIYRVKQELTHRWKAGKARPVYLNGHSDSIYCLQFDEYGSHSHSL